MSSQVSTYSCFGIFERHFGHCVLRSVQVLGTAGSASRLVHHHGLLMQDVFGEFGFLKSACVPTEYKHKTATMCFTKTHPLALLFPLKPSLVGAGCPGAVSSFASSFFCRLCWWPTVVAETCQVVVRDCTRDPSFRSIASPRGRYLVHSGVMSTPPTGRLPTRHIDDNIYTEKSMDSGEHSGLWTRRRHDIDSLRMC